MKRENVYLVGASLLASTALTTAAGAATFSFQNNSAALAGAFSTTARPLSAQAFAATPSSTQVIGPGSLFVKFTSPLQSDNLTIVLTAAGAKFVTSTVPAQAQILVISSGVSIQASAGTTLGSITAQPDKLVISGLNFLTSSGSTSVQGITISNISFDNATGLATAGGSITIAADITVGGTTSIESTAATAIVTSRNSVTGTSTSNAAIGQANVSSSIPFAQIVGTGLSALIGTISITYGGAVAADLTTAITGTAAVGANSEIKVTTPIITGGGFSALKLAGSLTTSLTRGLTQAASGAITFAIATGASIAGDFTVFAEFNGTTAIDTAAAGTTAVTFVSAGAQSQTANSGVPAAIAGTVSGISRSGLSIDVNGVQPGTAQGATTYTSLLRIANTGTASGTVTVVVKNEASGATLGTYTSASIPGGASLQVSAAQIESGAGITPTASVLYRLTISGSINGYVQHVNWNQNAGFFSDLSGRRTSVGGNN